ncbi:phosphatase PAP2 family protein [[Acholeplasma] multilocale]|uniref:phosphatase PAP2 family protein n=1 Tax=[Acholeplasma] multilocale TaxID=264638 RepID=UPI00047CFA12|nr:phosphatase PAP2 family protein [[Acholeplasma] multilocale]
MDFKREKKNWILISMISFFVVAFAAFIAATFYDFEIQEWFTQGMDYPIVRWWVALWDEMGKSQMIIVIVIILFVMFESFVFYHKTKKTKWAQGKRWAVYTVYGIWLTIWLAINIYWILAMRFMDDGWGQGFDSKLVDTYVPRMTARIFLFIVESIIMMSVFYFLRFKFSKRKDVLTGEYWVDSLKVLIFIGFGYIMIFIFKQSFGRPYFYSVVFDDVIRDKAMELGVDPSLIDQGPFNQADYKEWYEINGNWLENLKYWLPWRIFNGSDINNAPAGWTDGDFPSGHTISTFAILALMFFFVGKHKTTNNHKGVKIFAAIWFIHLLSMNFSLIVFRFHWLTDTTFAMMFSIVFLPIASVFTERMTRKIIVKFNAKRNIENKTFILKEGKSIKVYVVHYKKEWILKTYANQKTFDRKFDKYQTKRKLNINI